MQQANSIINNQQGSIITMALIFLALLTLIGITATNTSTTEVQVSANAVLHNVAFYTADSGIAAGRAALNNIKLADAGNWDKLLFNLDAADEDKQVVTWNGVNCTTLNDIIDAGGGRTVGPARFTLTIQDNEDLDGNPEVDVDDTIFLTSTLESPYRNATATIRTTVRGGGEAYAQEHYNAGSSGEAAVESEAASTDIRW
jgi:hypothetical protein